MAEPDVNAQNMRDLMAMVRGGTLSPRVTAAYVLDDYASAFSDLAMRRVTGKVVIHPSG
jgi:NADPH:quinone reductase-like Zn-dependent oxidoreductase